MRISRIMVKNHRAITDLDIPVGNHLVIVGPNESGKTRLLEILNLILTNSERQISYNLNSSNPIRDFSKDLELEVDFCDIPPCKESDERIAFGNLLEDPKGDHSDVLTLRLCARMSVVDEEISFERGFKKPGVFKEPSQKELDLIRWTYLPANRQIDDELRSNRNATVRQMLDSVITDNSKSKIREALNELHQILNNAKEIDHILSEIASMFSDLLPRKITDDEVRLGYPSVNQTDYLKGVNLHIQDKADIGKSSLPYNRPLYEQSDGVKAMAVIAIQLLTMDEASILAVDEPEIHLHPRAQARLTRWLKEKGGQRIIATHSSTVLEGFSPEEVLAFNPLADCRVLDPDVMEGDPKIFLHRWNSAVLELATSRVAVLVEGDLDRMLVLAVANALECDFDRLGVAIGVVDGVRNFPHWINLFGNKGFGVPLIGLFDKDKGDNNVKLISECLDVSPESLNRNNFWYATSDLEEEIVRSLDVKQHMEILKSSMLFNERDFSEFSGENVEPCVKCYLDFLKHRSRKAKSTLAFCQAVKAMDQGDVQEVLKKIVPLWEIIKAVKNITNDD